MTGPTFQSQVDQKTKLALILFWVFVVIFIVSAVFAFIALAIVFVDPQRADTYPTFGRLVWALWGVVLSEVAFGIFALYRNLFGLSARENVATLGNTLSELIDGLEADEKINESEAEVLREQYADRIGTPNPVYRSAVTQETS